MLTQCNITTVCTAPGSSPEKSQQHSGNDPYIRKASAACAGKWINRPEASKAWKNVELNQWARGIKFLQTETDLANIFLDFGETSNERAHQDRSRCDAETGYRSILRFLSRLLLTAEESADFDHRIALLRTRVLATGITL